VNKGIIQAIAVMTLCFLFGALLYSSDIFAAINEQWIEQQIRNNGWRGVVYYLLVIGLGTAVGLPRQFAAFLGGYAFGFLAGTFLATIAATIGCALSFTFARTLARPLINKKFADKVSAIQHFLREKLFTKTLIIRLMPAGNNLLTNLVAGVCKLNAKVFIGASLVGFIPQMAIFALAGSGFVVLEVWKLILSALLFVISLSLSMKLYYDYQKLNNESQH
jgi:uncharacterized membrane protein YdjX (TVP38/TMEM64 family)